MSLSVTDLLAVLVLAAALGLWAYSIVDFSRTDARDVRSFPQPVWLVIIVLGSVVGGILWLIAGRPRTPQGSRHGPR